MDEKAMVFSGEEIDFIKKLIETKSEELLSGSEKHLKSCLYNKLSQKTKTLEELGWIGEHQKKYGVLFYNKNSKRQGNEKISDLCEIFCLKDKTVGGKNIDELIAIVNKAITLFGYENVSK